MSEEKPLPLCAPVPLCEASIRSTPTAGAFLLKFSVTPLTRRIMKYFILTILIFPFMAFAEVGKKYKSLLDYKDVTVTRITPSKISIRDENGSLRGIPVKDLPEYVRKDLGLTMEEAEDHEKTLNVARKKQAEADRQRRIIALQNEKIKESLITIVKGSIVQVYDDAVLAYIQEWTDGELVNYSVIVGENKYDGLITETRQKLKIYKGGENVYLIMNPGDYVDGDNLRRTNAYIIGKHSYNTVGGSKATIRKLTVYKDVARKALRAPKGY